MRGRRGVCKAKDDNESGRVSERSRRDRQEEKEIDGDRKSVV